MIPRYLQIFGERCSGTNLVESLLVGNFPQLELRWDFGYKHFLPQARVGEASDYLVVAVYRHAEDWLRSLHRTPWCAALELKNRPIGEFMRGQWWCVWDRHANVRRDDPRFGQEMMFERDPDTGERFANVVQMRNAKVRAWERVVADARFGLSVQMEQVRQNPEAFVQRVACQTGLQPVRPFVPVKTYKGLKWWQGWKTRGLRGERAELAPEDRQFLRAQLDLEQEAAIGYRYE